MSDGGGVGVSVYLSTIREVFKARNRKTNHMVALKKVRMENEKEGVSPAGASCHCPLLHHSPPSSVSNDSSERDSHSTTSQT